MPDSPIDKQYSGPYDPRMEFRVTRLEDDMRDVKGAIIRLESAVSDVRQSCTRIETLLPHLATKADLSDKPGKTYLWGILAGLLTAYACGLAALSVLK